MSQILFFSYFKDTSFSHLSIPHVTPPQKKGSLPPQLSPTLLAVPRPLRLFLQPHARPMEPLIRTVVIIARHHIPMADSAAGTVLGIVPLALIALLPFLAIYIHTLGIGFAQYGLAVPRVARRELFPDAGQAAAFAGAVVAAGPGLGGRSRRAALGGGVQVPDSLMRRARVLGFVRCCCGLWSGPCAAATGNRLEGAFWGARAKGGLPQRGSGWGDREVAV